MKLLPNSENLFSNRKIKYMRTLRKNLSSPVSVNPMIPSHYVFFVKMLNNSFVPLYKFLYKYFTLRILNLLTYC